jgi:CRISPR-associated protein Cas1
MLTFPDFKAKQVLFIQTEHGAKNRLYFKNENIVFEKEGKLVNQASCHRVLAVFVIGDFSFTSGLVKECRKRAVSLFFLGNNFGLYGALNARAEGNYLLRMSQYAMSENREFNIAKSLVKNKISNQMQLLKFVENLGERQISEVLLAVDSAITKEILVNYFSEIILKKLIGFAGCLGLNQISLIFC